MADDMGLGKSIQAIKAFETALVKSDINKVLIVSPVNLTTNWLNELLKWSPRIRAEVVRPKKNEFDIEWLKAYEKININYKL